MSWFDSRVSRIIELELEITEALIAGHKAHEEDRFKSHREELKKLREEIKLERRAEGRG